MNKLITTAVLLFVFITSSAFATAQYPDKIVYEGKEYELHTNPMEAYFAKHPDKKPRNGIVSSALWRGYVATFEFKTNSLVLKDIQIQVLKDTEDRKYDTSWKSVRGDVVPKGEELPVDWFTGILVLPHGTRVKYVHL